MKNFYAAYTRVVFGTTYYFVKKYGTFPEFKNVSDVLEGYGMHTDFNSACNIAEIDNDTIRQQLLNSIQEANFGKVVSMNVVKSLSASNG
ncbi:MAG: hypothetical protein H0W12_12690 [Chitinophagaceae bacterium]|nr:hypothetical protein [Chitinophagaceae bacterium]